MRNKRTGKKRKTGLLLLIIFLVLTAACAVFLVKRPDYRLRIKLKVRSIIASQSLKTSEPDCAEMTLEELMADDRTVCDQSMMLISKDHLLSDDFCADISNYKDTDVIMNTCIQKSYEELAKAVKEKYQEKLYVREAYRTAEQQQEQVETNAENAAAVGASEHQAGLALDVYVAKFAGAGFTKAPAGQFVNESCGEYGFIIRYPSYGVASTGIHYEPWHIRYVGYPHSKIIMDQCLTLEEYMEKLEYGTYFEYKDYLITRVNENMVSVPKQYETAVVSPDNCGGYVLTFKR